MKRRPGGARNAPRAHQPGGIAHLTLGTGHTRISPRHEVRDDVVVALQPLVGAAQADPVPVPGMPGLTLKVSRAGQDAAFTIFTMDGAAPVVTCALGVSQAEALWDQLRAMHDRLYPDRPSQERRPPRAPWLAVVLLPGLVMLDQEQVKALGDLERCLAWALLESC